MKKHLTMSGHVVLATLLSVAHMTAYAAAHPDKHASIEEVVEIKMPSLHIHGAIGMGYYNISQATIPGTASYAAAGGSYSGIGLGYLFRPLLHVGSSIEIGETELDAAMAFSVKPTASILNDSFGNTQEGVMGSNGPDSAMATIEHWTLGAHNPRFGKIEAGKAVTESAKAAMASFSPFHRLRGGYEDAVTALTEVATISGHKLYAPLITYFGATSALLDAPHVSYKTPNFRGFTLASEYAPSPYITDIGGVDKNAYAFSAQFRCDDEALRYDARISYAHNVLNGYPAILANTYLNNSTHEDLLLFPNLVFGNQINTSAAIGYYGFDASISYGRETNTTIADVAFKGDTNYILAAPTAANISTIKPYIVEGTLGYTFHMMKGCKTGVIGSYAQANDYAMFYDTSITSSKATMWGLGLGHFMGNISMELKLNRYNTKSTNSSGRVTPISYSGNILSFATMYQF